MDGGNDQQKTNNSSLREEIANILPQQKEAIKPAPLNPVKPDSTPIPKKDDPEEQKLVFRTMASDLENVKKGQTPGGFGVKKAERSVLKPSPKIGLESKKEAAPITPPTELPKPKISLPTQLPPKIERPETTTPPTAPPKKRGGVLKWVIIVLVLAIIGYGITWFLFIRDTEEPEPSPTPTITVTPAPQSLQDVFGVLGEFVVTSDQFDPFKELLFSIDAQLIELNETKAFVIVDEQGRIYELNDALMLLGVDLPDSLTSNIDLRDYVMIVYGQTEEFDNQGNLVVTSGSAARFKRIGFVIKINDTAVVEESMLQWEDIMVDELGNLFSLADRNPSGAFGSSIYNGVNVRYRNFPHPDLSIDYALASSFTGNNYLVITNSREAIYSSVDKLLGYLGE